MNIHFEHLPYKKVYYLQIIIKVMVFVTTFAKPKKSYTKNQKIHFQSSQIEANKLNFI